MADETEAEEHRDEKSPFRDPNIAAIADLLRADGDLHDGEGKAQKAAAANAKIYTRIEKDLGGNKDAAKAVRRLVKMGKKASDDFMRTFVPLAEHLELYPERDLADYAEGGEFVTDGRRGPGFGYVPGVRAATAPDEGEETESPDGDDDDDDGDGAAAPVEDEAEVAAEEAAPSPFKSALDKGRSHMGDRGNATAH